VFPLAFVQVEADEEGRIQAIDCRDSEWTLDYEMPPLKIMQIRLAGLSRIDPTQGRRAALEIEMDGTCWELDEAGEPPALGFARLLKREDPDVILSEWGDSTILPLLRQQAERFEILPELESGPGGVCSAIESAQLYELRADTLQSQRNNALRSNSCGQAEFIHFGEVRFRRSLGTRTSHQTTYPICG